MKIRSVKLPSLLFAATLLVGACGPLIEFGDGSAAPTLYSIQPTLSGDISTGGPVVYVSEPVMPGEASGTQIAVRTDGFELSFLGSGRWSEPFRLMMHRYLAADLADNVQAQIVGTGALDISADCRLMVDFQRFDYALESESVVVQATVRLSSLKSGKLLGSKVISVDGAVAVDRSDQIVAGYNHAAGELSAALTLWLTDVLPACEGAD